MRTAISSRPAVHSAPARVRPRVHRQRPMPNPQRSGFCGVQVCTFKIWLRRGKLLKLEADMLGMLVKVGTGQRPLIEWLFHGGGAQSMRWDGSAFR